MDRSEKIQEKNLERLLRDKDFAALDRSVITTEPNIFRIISAENRELHHSNFLAFLFDPKKNHPFGTSFFQSFCREMGLTLQSVCKLDVRREDRNIDLLIVDKANNLVVVIENKVYAQEGVDQLRRYRKIIDSDESYRGWRKAYFFLSMTGEKPVGDSAWKAIGYDLLAGLIGRLSRKTRVSAALALVIRNYREIISGALMTEKQEMLCERIIGKNQHAVESVIQYGFSRKIEGSLISALVMVAENKGLKILKTIDRISGNSFHVIFTSEKFPQGLFFQFFINGAGGIWLILGSWANKNRKLDADFSRFSKKHPQVFNKIKSVANWRCFYENEFIDHESGLSESERVARIVQKWNEFLSNDFVDISNKLGTFQRARSSR